jgi:hypothetical protein
MSDYWDEQEEEVLLCVQSYPMRCPVLKALEHVKPYFEEAPICRYQRSGWSLCLRRELEGRSSEPEK